MHRNENMSNRIEGVLSILASLFYSHKRLLSFFMFNLGITNKVVCKDDFFEVLRNF